MIAKCRIADFNIELDLKYQRTCDTLSEFFADFDKADIKIKISPEQFQYEREIFKKDYNVDFHEKTLEINAVFRLLAENISLGDAAVLHSCAFGVENKGIAFSAKSGTGKTTHMLLWKEMLKDKFQIVNGDKPIIRFIDGKLYMYGTPWAGKENLKENIRVPLTDICQIVRSKTNVTTKMSKEEGFNLLMNQIYMPTDFQAKIKTLQFVNKVAENVNFWKIACNMENTASEVSYKAIFGD